MILALTTLISGCSTTGFSNNKAIPCKVAPQIKVHVKDHDDTKRSVMGYARVKNIYCS